MTIDNESLQRIKKQLAQANAEVRRDYPGDSLGRQPVHTLYGGAQIFSADLARKMGEGALKALAEYAPDAKTLGEALGIDPSISNAVYDRVVEKLKREPVEDFRIDFEDGYGNRPDAEEDGHAASAAREVAKAMAEGTLPAFIGIRVKTLSDELFPRAARTLDIFLTTLLEATGGKLPPGLVLTLPKITCTEQVTAFADLLEAYEKGAKLPKGTLVFELMVETTQSMVGPEGECALPLQLRAGRGRIVGAHFGTYDYTASNDITAAHQTMAHPACDFARQMMKVTLAGTGVLLSDGATNVMPVAPHKPGPDGKLTEAQRAENRRVVHRGWKLAYDHIRQSLRLGFYQGWDLHPNQLPVRYAATYAFFLEGADAAASRLKGFMQKAAQATLLGDVFDDAATGQGLLNFFLRGVSCGAISNTEVAATGLTLNEIATRSFLKILQDWRNK